MGNYVSCTLASPLINNSKAARVVFPGGEVRQFRHPVKAAEIMLECPNFFLVNSQSLHIGRRFSALAADEEVEFGNVYIMFPMKRLNSIVTAADMAALFMAANSAAKRISGANNKIRVLPGDGNTVQESQQISDGGSRSLAMNSSSSDDENKEEETAGFPAPEYKYKLSVCRSRKPTLETIKEEPVRYR